MDISCSFTASSENTVKTKYLRVALKHPIKVSFVKKLGVDIQKHQKVSRKVAKILFFLITMTISYSALYADIGPDEDVLFYDMTVDESFRPFFKKYHRYPHTWTELKFKSSCYGGKDNYPKPNEGSIWHPDACEMS
jgi:hypothetical protein